MNIINKIRLVFSLMRDKRISIWLKMIPVIALVYLVVPFDFLFGPLDDALIIYTGFDLFISLCSREVVNELSQRIIHGQQPPDESGVIDADFKD